MTESRAAHPTSESRAPRSPSLLRSVVSNWSWYVVVAVTGFVLPRFIDDFHGPVLLGVWDFSWSLVVYVSFLAFGVSSAVNRYVARFRVLEAWRDLNETVNASLLCLLVAAALGLVVAGGLAYIIPALLTDLTPDQLRIAQAVVLILGGKSALQILGGVFNGIITGYERFDILNAIRITRDVLLLAALVGALVAGAGLVTLAVILLGMGFVGETAKFIAARRICRQLQLGLNHASPTAVREILGFGAKTFAQTTARATTYHASSILVGVFLGPAALALFARQRSLVMHLVRIVKQYAQVFVPRASTIDADRRDHDLRRLLMDSSRYGFYLTLPPALLLIALGDVLLRIWMGPDYEAPVVLTIMVVAHAVFVPQLGIYAILMGLGKHGIPALYEAAAALISVACGALALGYFDGGLIAAAITMSVPPALAAGVVLPIHACRLLELPIGQYLRKIVPGPLLANTPLLALLVFARAADLDALPLLIVGVGLGGLLTFVIYFAFVLPPHLRERLWGALPRITAITQSPRSQRAGHC